MAARRRSPIIAFLIMPPFDLFDFTGIASAFEMCKFRGTWYYEIQVLSTEANGFVRANNGITISNASKYSDYTGSIDTLVVIGGEATVVKQSPGLLKWIRDRAMYARRVASICTGAFVLAATGLLDGRRVTTHWRYCDLLLSSYRKVKVERNPIFIKDDKFYSTAGVSAGIDLALTLVEEDLGHAAAASLARELVLFVRRAGAQSQYSTLLAQQEAIEDALMRDLPVWVKAHLTRKLDVEMLAHAVAMSPRTFVRHFRSYFNTTPARWVQSIRVETVMQHLENHDVALSQVAIVTGFRDEQAMRRAFLQQTGVTPRQYRERFGAVRLYAGSDAQAESAIHL
jgi:transcriptional regulator GlxA family with amidase domain